MSTLDEKQKTLQELSNTGTSCKNKDELQKQLSEAPSLKRKLIQELA